jgi:hypothetical protein
LDADDASKKQDAWQDCESSWVEARPSTWGRDSFDELASKEQAAWRIISLDAL